MSPPTVLVAGAGRGIGRAVVEAFADAGWRAVAGVRDVAAAEEAYAGRDGVLVAPLDVTDPEAVEGAVAAAEAHAGGALSCVVLNAGYAVMGAVEDVDLDAVREMYETNVFGAAAVVQRALPRMRAGGGGTLVFVSSVGARFTNPLVGMYHTSKHALSSMAEALAIECRPFGVRVATVEPGMVRTDFPRATRPTGALSRSEGPYAPLLAALRPAFAEWRRAHEVGPEVVAAAVLAAATDPGSPFRIEVGEDTRLIARMRHEAADVHDFHDWLVGFLGVDWPRALR